MRRASLCQSFSGGQKYLLDEYSDGYAAYSLRNLSSTTINDPLVRVRRNSDNAEQNFLSSEITDGTLEAFTGTGVTDFGYVSIWYDQTNNNYNISSTIASNQPIIIYQGGLLTDPNGKPYVYYTGSNQKGLFLGGLPNVSLNFWAAHEGISSQARNCILNVNGSRAAGVIQQGSGTSASPQMSGVTYTKNNQAITATRGSLYNELQIDQWTLARLQNVNNLTTMRPFSWDSTQNYWNGACRVSEVVGFSTSQTEIQGVQDNINNYYLIY
jgi:hypothetical protein